MDQHSLSATDPGSDPGSGQHPVIRAAGQARAAMKSIHDCDPVLMTTAQRAEAMRELQAARDACTAALYRVAAVSGDVADEAGARDVGAWLACETRADRGAAAAEMTTATALASRWRATEQALATGVVTVPQARVIATGLGALAAAVVEHTDLTPTEQADVLARAETELIRLAGDHPPRDLRRLAERILTVVAPDCGEEVDRRALERAEAAAEAQTSLRSRRRGDGSTDIFLRVPDSAAARLRTYLDAFTSPRTTAGAPERAAAGGSSAVDGTAGSPPSLGRSPLDADIDPATGARVPAHRRRGVAFLALLEAMEPERMPLHGGDATTLVVTIDLAHLLSGLGEAITGDGTRITAGQARRLACTAGIVPAVLDGASRPLDVGRRRRLFTPAQRTALRLMHQTCQAHGCDVPSAWCEAHHRRPWSADGPTDLDNAMVLCSWHHHRIHDPAYRHRLHPDGSIRYARRT